jgi:hypothetical protein
VVLKKDCSDGEVGSVGFEFCFEVRLVMSKDGFGGEAVLEFVENALAIIRPFPYGVLRESVVQRFCEF